MKKKLKTLSAWSFVLALAIFFLAFIAYHYITPDGSFSAVFREEAGKPFVSFLLANLGVMFLFNSILDLLITKIFYPED